MPVSLIAVLASFVALLAWAESNPARAAMFKCTDATGKVAYQDSPCENQAQEHRVGTARAEGGGQVAHGGADDRRRREVIQTALMAKPFCDQAVPGFKQRTTAQYASWRQRNAATIASIESDPDFRERLARYIDVRTTKMKAENGRPGVTCDDGMLDFMNAPAPMPASPRAAAATGPSPRPASAATALAPSR